MIGKWRGRMFWGPEGGRPVGCQREGKAAVSRARWVLFRSAWAGVLLLLVFLAFPAIASAGPRGGTIVVNTTADDGAASLLPTDCTLRDAIASANTHQAVGGCTAGVANSVNTIELQQPGEYSIRFGLEDFTPSSDMNIVGQGA